MVPEALPNPDEAQPVDPELKALNDKLQEMLAPVFGDKVHVRIVDPKSLVLLKVNAHYMQKPMFDQLTANVETDGFLSSVPLCHTLKSGGLEVLSGNHRVQAAIEAKQTRIVCLVIPHTLPRSKKTAIQISHNALVGADDKAILKQLWGEIDDLTDKMYSGLDSKTLGELDDISFTAFNAAQVKSEKIVLWFVPEEVTSLDSLLAEAAPFISADAIYLAPAAKYEALFREIVKVKARNNIKNTAVAFWVLIDRMREGLARIEADEKAAKAQQEQQAPPG